jgi:hypothetical protein
VAGAEVISGSLGSTARRADNAEWSLRQSTRAMVVVVAGHQRGGEVGGAADVPDWGGEASAQPASSS